jgi:transposase-like protein
MADKRVRRFWDDAEKIQIVAQTRVPGVSVAKVARRYDVNANLIFKWLRDPRLEVASVTGYDWSIPFLQNSRRRLHASVRSRRIRPLHDGVINRIGRTISECAVIFRAASTSAS